MYSFREQIQKMNCSKKKKESKKQTQRQAPNPGVSPEAQVEIPILGPLSMQMMDTLLIQEIMPFVHRIVSKIENIVLNHI